MNAYANAYSTEFQRQELETASTGVGGARCHTRHFLKSKRHTPIGDEGGPKGIHEHVSDLLHTAAGKVLQDMAPLEHVIIGIGSSSTGMHHPGAVVFHAEPHHWQHLLASHSSAVGSVQFSLGTGGTGAATGATLLVLLPFACLCATDADLQRVAASVFVLMYQQLRQ